MKLRNTKCVMICSVCWRARYEPTGLLNEREGWRNLEALIADEQLEGEDYALSQGYCPTCLEAFLQESHARQVGPVPSHTTMPRQLAH